jgi:PadR family transcriptional regulator, regulatory protein AphA
MKLTPTSFIVLGLIEGAGGATPYELKVAVSRSVGNFWSLQHAQLYTETERLAKAGYLSEEREETGRRRRRFTITDVGRAALDEWRAEPPTTVSELRDQGMLKLFFGADPDVLAPAQLDAHRRKLEEYEAHLAEVQGREQEDEARCLVLQAGIAHQEVWIRFWSALLPGGRRKDARRPPKRR